MRLSLAYGHLTGIVAETVDAITNEAHPNLLGGGGVDGAVHRAGGREVLQACKELRRTSYPDGLPVGDAVATTAGQLPCRWIIHTVAPAYNPRQDRTPILRSCYTRCLLVAAELGATSVAFPLLAAGPGRWPTEDAIRLALTALTPPATTDLGTITAVTLLLHDHGAYRLAERLLHQTEPRSNC